MPLLRRLFAVAAVVAALVGCAGQTRQMPADDAGGDVPTSSSSGQGAGRVTTTPVEAGP